MVKESGTVTASASLTAMAVAYSGDTLEQRKQEIENRYAETGEMARRLKDDLTLFFVFSYSIVQEYSIQLLAKYVISDRFQTEVRDYLDEEMSQSHREDLLCRCGLLDSTTQGHITNLRGIWKKLVRKPHAPISWDEDHFPSEMERAIAVTEELYGWLVPSGRIERAVTRAKRLSATLSDDVEDAREEGREEGMVVGVPPSTTQARTPTPRIVSGSEGFLKGKKATIEKMYAKERAVTDEIEQQLQIFFIFSHGMIEEYSAQLIQKYLVDGRFEQETYEYFHDKASQTHREKLLTQSGIFLDRNEGGIRDDISEISPLRHDLAHQPTDPVGWDDMDITSRMATAIDGTNRLYEAEIGRAHV